MRRFWKKYGKAVVAVASTLGGTISVIWAGGEASEIAEVAEKISNAMFAIISAAMAAGILTYAAPANREDE